MVAKLPLKASFSLPRRETVGPRYFNSTEPRQIQEPQKQSVWGSIFEEDEEDCGWPDFNNVEDEGDDGWIDLNGDKATDD